MLDKILFLKNVFWGGGKILTWVTCTNNLKSEMPLALEVANMCIRDHINICWLIFLAFFFLFIFQNVDLNKAYI